MRWVMVVGPLAILIACGGRSERLIGDDAGAGGASGDGNDTGGSAGKGKGGSSGGAGTGGSGGSVSTGGTGGSVSTGGSTSTGGSGGGKGGTGGGKGITGGTGGTFPGKGGNGGFGAFGGVAGKAPVAGGAGIGSGGFGASGGMSGASGSGGAGGSAGLGGSAGNGGAGGAMNSCTPNPCLNGGICLAGPNGSLSCECPAGFGGSRCEIASNPCPVTPCMHGGECVASDAGSVCVCPSDWRGTHCECRESDEPVGGGCRLQGVCGFAEPATYASANCSANTSEFADWWCQLAGYAGAESYQTLTQDFHEALFYEGGSGRQVLSECSQVVYSDLYIYGPDCTGVRELVCRGEPISEAMRQKALVCGHTNRDVASFLPPGSGLLVEDGCAPDATTQALLVTRDGVGLVATDLRAYLHGGGVLLTEYSNSDELFSMVFPSVLTANTTGSCNDNAPTTVRFSASDRFWLDNPYQAIPYEQTGCGFDVSDFPLLVPLGGWSASTVGMGYRNLGRGRFWATDFDWSDLDSGQIAYTRSLLGYMITHRR